MQRNIRGQEGLRNQETSSKGNEAESSLNVVQMQTNEAVKRSREPRSSTDSPPSGGSGPLERKRLRPEPPSSAESGLELFGEAIAVRKKIEDGRRGGIASRNQKKGIFDPTVQATMSERRREAARDREMERMANMTPSDYAKIMEEQKAKEAIERVEREKKETVLRAKREKKEVERLAKAEEKAREKADRDERQRAAKLRLATGGDASLLVQAIKKEEKVSKMKKTKRENSGKTISEQQKDTMNAANKAAGISGRYSWMDSAGSGSGSGSRS